MSIGLMLFMFLAALILISTHPRERWHLSSDDPLNEDNLRWAAAGYGSASISLDCLFGAYSAMLLLIGRACFLGVATGVMTGLLVINWRMNNLYPGLNPPSFQAVLYGLQVFDSPILNKFFWLLVAFCQVGLAVSELVLMNHVFLSGMGFPAAHAIAATLAIACVAYYYCLFGGYQAVYRTDALQYIFIILMGLAMLFAFLRQIAGPLQLAGLATALQKAQPIPPKQLMAGYPHLRLLLELLGGFSLGIMPVLAAPDAWKRVFIVAMKRNVQGPRLRLLRAAPLRLFLATAVPLVFITPLLLASGTHNAQGGWGFPISDLFAISSPVGDSLIVLGMVAVFMSTFASSLLSATHVLMGQLVFREWTAQSELARFRVIFGLCFAASSLCLFGLLPMLPNPYAVGVLLVTPFGLVSGILTGTSFGDRKARWVITYLIGISVLAWVVFAIGYLTDKTSAADPYAAVYLVLLGCATFFVAAAFSRVFSRK
jgi:Na+/proline symporter